MTRVLISCPLVHGIIDVYENKFQGRGVEYDSLDVNQNLDEDELLDCIDRYDGVLAGDDEFTRKVFQHANRLQVISKWGIGTDSIDKEAAAAHGVAVYNTPGAFADEVADVVMGYLVMLARDLHLIDRSVRRGEWFCPRGDSLAGRTMGVIGVGSIGETVARRGSAFGMDIIGHDISPISDNLQQQTDIEAVSKRELFERADVVSLNCPLTPETENIVSATELNLLGTDGYLINTARGELINQGALEEALAEGRIAGAALDVFETEPLPEENPLTELDNVILGSHNAQNTHEAVHSVTERAIDNLFDGLDLS